MLQICLSLLIVLAALLGLRAFLEPRLFEILGYLIPQEAPKRIESTPKRAHTLPAVPPVEKWPYQRLPLDPTLGMRDRIWRPLCPDLAEDAQSELHPKLRLAFFSDYHAGQLLLDPSRFLKAILLSAPDLVVFGGDLSSSEKDRTLGLEHFRYYAKALKALGIPFLAIWGNHDEGLSRQDAESTGAIWLANEHYILDRHNERWAIIGLEDLRLGQPSLEKAMGSLEVPPERRLLFAHNPDTLLQLDSDQFRACFSGHYHNGQVRLPARLEFKLLRPHDRLSRYGYYHGLFSWKKSFLYIGRGCGSVLLPLRLFSVPELAIFDIL